MLVLGYDVVAGKEVTLSPEDRKQGTYIVGITGAGKTSLLLNIALSDMQAGDGLCVLDPHGDLTEDLLIRVPHQRRDDVILFDPADIDYPFGLNLFECSDISNPMEVDLVCSQAIGTFWKLFYYSWGPQMEDLLRNVSLTLIYNRLTMSEIPRLLTDEEYRANLVGNIPEYAEQVRLFWQKTYDPLGGRFPHKQLEYSLSTLNKVRRFLLNTVIRNIVGQTKSSFDFRQIMDQGKILLVKLAKGRIGEDNSSLLGSIIVGKILLTTLSRADMPPQERKPFHLIVDEYQSFATSSFPTLQSEARKYNIDTIVAHQYRDQLDEDNKGSTLNVGNKIAFRVSGKDALGLAAEFDITPPEPEPRMEPVFRRLGSNQGLFTSGGIYHEVEGPRRLFSDVLVERANELTNLPRFQAKCKLVSERNLVEHTIETQPPSGVVNPQMAGYIRKRSRQLTRPRREIEEEMKKRTGLEQKQVVLTEYEETRGGRRGSRKS